MNQPRSIFLGFFAALLLLSPFCPNRSSAKEIALQPQLCISEGWPHAESDLKPDPSLIFGTLKNGVRYMLMPNHEPMNRVALYLNIQAGSLQETEAQRGLAHYLEHMMFNGTTHYPPGSLVEYFQSIGMSFGPDTNAHTSYDETVYQLMLPDGKDKTLRDGLRVLADYAGGALLLEKEVERERGVILAEKRERNSAGRRIFKQRNKQLFAGTLVARRDVIGTDEVLQTADAALLRQYYEQWYRPDTILVTAVGDTDMARLEQMVKKYFSPLKARNTKPACLDFGKVPENGTEAFYQFEPDFGSTIVSIASVRNLEPSLPTKKEALQHLTRHVAETVMDYRLDRLTDATDSPVTGASFYFGKMIGRVEYTGLEARTDATGWRESLTLLDTALRQALLSGFNESELKRAKEEIMTALQKEVQAADSRRSSSLAAEIINTFNNRDIMLSPQQKMDLYGPALEKITLKDINATFRSLWGERRLVKVAGTAELQPKNEQAPQAEAVVLAAFNAAEAAKITPWVEEEQAPFPYLPLPKTKASVDRHIVYSKIGAERYLFTNGLILNLKVTDFEPNEVRLTAVLGNGQLSEPKPGLSMLAQMVLPESGVGGMTKQQLEVALASYSGHVSLWVDEGRFKFKGKGLRSETELLFQLLYTKIHDPGFRPEAFQRVMKKIEQMYARLRGSVEGMMELRGEQFLAGNNLRYGIVPQALMRQLTLKDIRDWLIPVFKEEGLEISVVGDFDREEVLRLAGQYFGDQRRAAGKQPAGDRIIFPAGKSLPLKVSTTSDKAQVVVAWPTADFWDISRTRRLSVLASVLDDRLRKQIREELGAAYSPYVYNLSSTVDPGHGVLRSVTVVDPDQAAVLAEKLKQVGAELSKGRVTKEELERALEPSLTSIRDMVRTNRYWLDSVLVDSGRHPRRLEWPLTIQSDFAAITAEELTALAKQYLGADRATTVILLPKETEKKEEKAEKK